MFDIEKILDRSDLLHYVELAGGHPVGNGTRYSCACPLHGGNNPTALSIYLQNGRWLWKCFTGGCSDGYKRDAISFVQVWQGLDFKRACEWIMGGALQDVEGLEASAARRLEQARLDRIAAQEREEARRNELRLAKLHVRYHNEMAQYHKDAWNKAGLDEGMQDFWTLGGKKDFEYWIGETSYHSPTLTIPIFNPQRELMTIQHRLLNPHDIHDKYRPERKGLSSFSFLAVPEMGYDGEMIWVMEGAKKAMITWTRSDTNWQCIGLPSQESYRGAVEILKPVGKRVVIVPDPNSARNKKSLAKAWYLAKQIGGRFLQVPYKIDDLILLVNLQKDDLFRMQLQARQA